MKKLKIITVDFPRKNQPVEGWWFPEESLMRLAETLLEESDLEEVERKVEMVEE